MNPSMHMNMIPATPHNTLLHESQCYQIAAPWPLWRIYMAVFGLSAIVNIGRYCGAAKRIVWRDFGSPPFAIDNTDESQYANEYNTCCLYFSSFARSLLYPRRQIKQNILRCYSVISFQRTRKNIY